MREAAMRVTKFLTTTALAVVLMGTAAQADVTISRAPTQNMTCSGGLCSPTAANAVLNATDLAAMLASGDVKVMTGSGATNIVVKASVGWANTSRLTLDAMQSVEIEKPLMVTGTGGVTVTTNDGGSGGDLMFDGKGNVTLWDLSSSLIVNGNSYTLVGNIATLASDIAANPSGFYALAKDYDASVDGTYTSAPIATIFHGVFEGLSHRISHLKIDSSDFEVGFFAETNGTLRDIGLTDISVQGDGSQSIVGGLLAESGQATIIGCYDSGKVTSTNAFETGGLIGASGLTLDGTMIRSRSSVAVTAGDGVAAGGLVGASGFAMTLSYANGRVSAGNNSHVGGLVGTMLGRSIAQSFATGRVTGASGSQIGGLIGNSDGFDLIQNVYATGATKSGENSETGGLIGEISATSVITSYSTGQVKGKPTALTGGLIGKVNTDNTLSNNYWDTSTTGKNGHQGCNDRRCFGQSKGRTTEQLQSGLPAGFSPSFWGEQANINDGLPYLLALPPR
jgi:hypothetical protein